jgi:hypothetical protein
MKYTKKDILNRVRELKEDCDCLHELIRDWDKYKIASGLFWDRVNELDRNAIGLVGKHIQFNVADGYAHYIIVKENKATVTVEHLDYCDGYHFTGVWDGKLPRGLAERQVKMATGLKEIFG